jgi:hypothetical protein
MKTTRRRRATGRFAPDAVASGAALHLRAERKGDGAGRVYLVVVSATDAAGLSGHACCSVVVPHAGSRTAADAVRARAAAAEAVCRTTGAPPSDFALLGDGPIIGPKQ